MKNVKIVIVGNTEVGKTCIATRFFHEKFDNSLNPTIGVTFLTKGITMPKGTIRMQLWDTAGQEKFRTLAPMYYRSAGVAILVYDISSKSSFDSIKSWASDILDKSPNNIKIVLVGNKKDLPNREVTKEAGVQLATDIKACYFVEVSARSGEGIEKLFIDIAELTDENNTLYESPPIKPVPPPPPKNQTCC